MSFVSFNAKDDRAQMKAIFKSSPDKDKYNLITYVTHNGASGYAGAIGTVCDATDLDSSKFDLRFSYIRASGPNQCNVLDKGEPVDCTPTNRVALTAEVMCNLLTTKYCNNFVQH